MNDNEFSKARENQTHGDISFHLMLHEYSADTGRSERVSPHWHEEFELLYVCEGCGTAHINSRCIEFEKGDIFFINSGALHSFFAAASEPFVFCALDFGRELLESSFRDDIQREFIEKQQSGELIFNDHFKCGSEIWEKIYPPLEEIRALCRENLPANKMLIKSDLLRIWHFLCSSSVRAAAQKKSSNEKIALIKNIMQYIKDNLQLNLSVMELSRHFHMSEGYLCRFFKAEVGMTAVEYINYCRIATACSMLAETDKSISEISSDCGYNNISYFNRTFRRRMGCSPREYRNS